MDSKRWSRKEAIGSFPPLETWPTVASDLVEPSHREIFENNCKAVSMYLKNISTDEIFSRTGIQGNNLPRMSKRCLVLAADGQILGFRALLPYMHVKTYEREAVLALEYNCT